MKNIIMTSKCGIAALLTLCILFSIAGIGVHAIAMAEEKPISTEEKTVATEGITPELMPTKARACNCPHDWRGNSNISSSSCRKCGAIGMREEICRLCFKTRRVCTSCGNGY